MLLAALVGASSAVGIVCLGWQLGRRGQIPALRFRRTVRSKRPRQVSRGDAPAAAGGQEVRVEARSESDAPQDRLQGEVRIDAVTMPSGGAATEMVCAICLDDESTGDVFRQLVCGHVFHAMCIIDSLRYNRACPCCRDLPGEVNTVAHGPATAAADLVSAGGGAAGTESEIISTRIGVKQQH